MADEIKKDEFELFCAELKKEMPDFEKIKAGVEKFGMGMFSDSQKEAFLKAVFPAPIQAGASEAEKLGLQNLHGIKNVLSAMQGLQKAGKINDEQIKSFLTMTNPANGRNVMTTIALNTWAAEFKLNKLNQKSGGKLKTNLENRTDGTDELKQKLENQYKLMVEIQDMFGELNPEVFAEVANTPDRTRDVNGNQIREIKYRNLAEKSQLMSERMKKIAPQLQQLDRQATERDNEEPVRVGGLQPDNALNVSTTEQTPPAENPPATNPPAAEDEEDKKIANLMDKGNDDSHGKHDSNWSFSGVKEQDIIDYMFQHWFLDGLNTTLETTFKLGDKLFDALTGNYDKQPKTTFRAPRTEPTAGATTPSSTATAGSQTTSGGGTAAAENTTPASGMPDLLEQMNRLATQTAAPYIELMQNIAGDKKKVTAIAKLIEANIGKKAEEWTTDAKIPTFKPLEHKGLIKMLNDMKMKNPQAFNNLLNKLQKNPQAMRSFANEAQIKLASQLAVVDLAAQNLGSELKADAQTQKKLEKATFDKIQDITTTAAQIRRAKEDEYRLQNNLKPTDKLTEKQQKALDDASAQEMLAYIKGTSERAVGLKELLNKHYLEQDASQKMLLEQQIKKSRKDLADFYGQYLSGNGEVVPARQNSNTPKNEPMDLRTAANVEISAQARENALTSLINANNEEQQHKRDINNARRNNLHQRRNGGVAPRTLRDIKKGKGRI